ncbi:prolipoprotein diacylglyceryl transferase [Nesterenkonia populi]|uniref:prolipoprotein diacylglyceryl transferase n=1 Tax=Nesterenkonia populi TaxID=1591087 RepID=UPI0011BEEDF0|nr:prolipoprotein diacylglyceryl transferase [Nesterenkonia populi]
MTALLASGFPPPPIRVIDLPGPFEVAMYALCIVVGGILAVVVASKLWKSRGGDPEDVMSATLWAVLLGIVGARLYHVVSSPDPYFGEGGEPLRAFRIWEGGLSIIGAVAFGALGVYIACRRNGMKFPALADAVVPGVILAQAIGRWGNWFNQELFGRATNLPWGLRIDLEQPSQAPRGTTEDTLFHPTFLYESIWNLVGFVALVWLYKRFQFRPGLVTLTYVAYYCLGRFWIESLRIDEATKSTQYPLSDLGLDWRLNQIIVFVIFVIAVAAMLRLWTKRPQTDEDLDEQLQGYRPGTRMRPLTSAGAPGAASAGSPAPEAAETAEEGSGGASPAPTDESHRE